MKNLLKKIFIFLSSIASTHLFAQETKTYIVRDIGTWSSLVFKYEFNDKIALGLSENIRLQYNSSKLNQHFTEFGIKYALLKNWYFVPEFRLGFKKDDSKMLFFDRISLSSNYKIKLNRLALEPRLAFQRRSLTSGDSLIPNDINIRFRYRLAVSYNFPNWKLDPELCAELFRNSTTKNGPEFNKYRLKLTTDIDINKLMDLTLFYAFQREFDELYPFNLSIIGIKLNFKSKRLVKEKK